MKHKLNRGRSASCGERWQGLKTKPLGFCLLRHPELRSFKFVPLEVFTLMPDRRQTRAMTHTCQWWARNARGCGLSFLCHGQWLRFNFLTRQTQARRLHLHWLFTAAKQAWPLGSSSPRRIPHYSLERNLLLKLIAVISKLHLRTLHSSISWNPLWLHMWFVIKN